MLNPIDLSADAPWKQRFRAPSIECFRAAQDPSRGLICSDKDGVWQLYAWNAETNEVTQLTDDPAGVPDGAISADGEFVYYLRDKGGNEIGHYARIPFAGGEPEDMTPNLPEYASHFLAESASGNRLGFSAVDDGGFHIYVFDKSRMTRPVFTTTKQALSFGPILSHDAEIAIIASTEKTGIAEYALEAYDVKSDKLIAELWDGAGSGIIPGEFSGAPGDMRFAGSSNASGYHRPFIWNPRSGEVHDILSEQFHGDVKAWQWSPDGARLLLHQVDQAAHALYVYDVGEDKARPLNLPAGALSRGSGFLEDGAIEAHLSDSTAPLRPLELDGESGLVLRSVIDLGLSVPDGIPWRSVCYRSTDGTPIQAWLATPPGDGPFPTVVHTHGGPTAALTNTWAPTSQAWLDHGCAWFSLNYRGSTTFGYDFQHAIDGNLGDLEVEDIAAGVAWLIENGIAQPDAILKTGGSYGGYLTLQSLGKKPDLWAGGMAVVAIADWTLMYEDQAGTLRGYQRSMFGGTPDEKPEAPPQSIAHHLRRKHRRPDSGAARRERYALSGAPNASLRGETQRAEQSIEIHWFDAGHGSLDTEEQIDQQEKMLRFAYRVLGM